MYGEIAGFYLSRPLVLVKLIADSMYFVTFLSKNIENNFKYIPT